MSVRWYGRKAAAWLCTPALATALAVPSAPARAQDIAIAAGVSSDGDGVVRLSYARGWPSSFLESSGFEPGWEANLTLWQVGPGGDATHSVALAPFLRRPLGERFALVFGLGLAIFDANMLHGRDMGSLAQFESRIGLDMALAPRHLLRLDARHYSNAGLADANHGIEIYTLSYVRRF